MMGWIKMPQGIIFIWERNGDGARALNCRNLRRRRNLT